MSTQVNNILRLKENRFTGIPLSQSELDCLEKMKQISEREGKDYVAQFEEDHE